MSICSDLYNAYFIDKLESKMDQDVILFGLDGMSYYGRLTEIDENNIASLKPASISSTNLVEIQNPAEIAAVENIVSIDVSYVVGFGYDISADPFVLPNDNAEDATDQETSSDFLSGSEIDILKLDDECNNDALINKLISMEQIITISTLGGFLFAGELLNIKEKTAKLKPEYIFAPGGDGSTLFSINKAFINLQAATAVAS